MDYKIIYQQDQKRKTKIYHGISFDDLLKQDKLPQNIIKIEKIKHPTIGFKKRSSEDYYDFFYEFSMLLESNLTLLEALMILRENNYSKEISLIIETWSKALQLGKGFHEVLSDKTLLPSIIIYFIQMGEEHGNIKKTIFSLSKIYKQHKSTKTKIIKALWYPMVLTITMLVSIFVMVFLILPEFEHIFNQLQSDLPITTQILLNIKDGLGVIWPYLFAIFSLLLLIFLIIWKQKKIVLEKILFHRLSFISEIYQLYTYYQLFLMVSIALETQQKLTEILSFIAKTNKQNYIYMKLDEIVHTIEKGNSVSFACGDANIFQNYILRLLKVGDYTNQYDDIFSTLSYVTKIKLEKKIDNFTKLIEPFLIFCLGIILMFMIIGILSPIWNITNII